MAKKCTKKRDPRAELLFCSKLNAFFDVPVAVAVVVSKGPLIVPTYRPTRTMTLCVTGYNLVSTKGVNPTIATRQNVINTDVNKYISIAFKCPKVK